MKKISIIIFCVILFAFLGCGGDGGSITINEPAPAPTPTPPDAQITLGAISGEFVEITFSSALLESYPTTEPGKVVGLMDEAIQIGDIQQVCWHGDKAGWSGTNHCTTSMHNQGRFNGIISIPIGDEGNFVAHLISTSKGIESWFNITVWTWPIGTVLDLNRGTAKLPNP